MDSGTEEGKTSKGKEGDWERRKAEGGAERGGALMAFGEEKSCSGRVPLQAPELHSRGQEWMLVWPLSLCLWT